MRIPKLDLHGRAVIILGAGASRGASFVARRDVSPPLDLDFFDQLQRLPIANTYANELLEFAREEFGSTLEISMEKFFSQLQFLHGFHQDIAVDRGPRIQRYDKFLKAFPQVVAEVFSRAFMEGDARLHCEHHDVLAGRLERNDAILSFNYDCLIDDSLRRNSGRVWNAQIGYGVEALGGYDSWHDVGGRGVRATGGAIRLLKLHGSLNWRRDSSPTELRLRKRPYSFGIVRHRRELIAPVWNKDVAKDPVLKEIWKQARNRLRGAQVLVVAGYSVPETDLMSQALVRVETASGEEHLRCLVVVNPSSEHRQKFKRLVAKSIMRSTRVIELGAMKDLARFLGN